MFARLARTGCQRPLELRALTTKCIPAKGPARFGIAWASTASTTAQRIVTIEKVPPGTTVEQLQAALPFSVTKLVSTSASRVSRALSLLTVVPAANSSSFRAWCDEAALNREVEGSPPKRIPFSGQILKLRLISRLSPSATLYVTGFPATATLEELAKALDVSPEAIVMSPRPGKGGAFARVQLSSVEDAQAIAERAEETAPKLGGQVLEVGYMRH
jgi:hypothetical protein